MAKRSRRERKQETEKRQQLVDAPQQASVAPAEAVASKPAPAAAPIEVGPSLARKTVDFAQEYYYVYTDLRNVTIIAALMIALMFGLGYFI